MTGEIKTFWAVKRGSTVYETAGGSAPGNGFSSQIIYTYTASSATIANIPQSDLSNCAELIINMPATPTVPTDITVTIPDLLIDSTIRYLTFNAQGWETSLTIKNGNGSTIYSDTSPLTNQTYRMALRFNTVHELVSVETVGPGNNVVLKVSPTTQRISTSLSLAAGTDAAGNPFQILAEEGTTDHALLGYHDYHGWVAVEVGNEDTPLTLNGSYSTSATTLEGRPLYNYKDNSGAVNVDMIPLYAKDITPVNNAIIDLKAEIDNLKTLGHFLFSVATNAGIPTTYTGITSHLPAGTLPTINDYITVVSDSTHNNGVAIYRLTAFDTTADTATFTFDHLIGADMTGKVDKTVLATLTDSYRSDILNEGSAIELDVTNTTQTNFSRVNQGVIDYKLMFFDTAQTEQARFEMTPSDCQLLYTSRGTLVPQSVMTKANTDNLYVSQSSPDNRGTIFNNSNASTGSIISRYTNGSNIAQTQWNDSGVVSSANSTHARLTPTDFTLESGAAGGALIRASFVPASIMTYKDCNDRFVPRSSDDGTRSTTVLNQNGIFRVTGQNGGDTQIVSARPSGNGYAIFRVVPTGINATLDDGTHLALAGFEIDDFTISFDQRTSLTDDSVIRYSELMARVGKINNIATPTY